MNLPTFDLLTPTDLAAPFWNGFRDQLIMLPACSRCGSPQWYPDSTGPDCVGATYEWRPASLTGQIYAKTRVHHRFQPLVSGALPFVVGLVDLDQPAGVRLVCLLDDDERLTIGARVRARFVRAGDRTQPLFEMEAM